MSEFASEEDNFQLHPIPESPSHSTRSHAERAKILLKAAKSFQDPWASLGIEKIPAERVRRHRYQPTTGKWIIDESLVKIERKPFSAGAMRYAYRMKKLSQVLLHGHNHGWSKVDWHQAPNYVSKWIKKYVDSNGDGKNINKSVYFKDVSMQYEAAHWAALYNQQNPPKKILVIQCYVIEFFERPGCPVMGCERFVDDGQGFVKHNSNSGFVDIKEHRMTPQAFSAFSFYASKGTMMVVDIQGVGDLYTDPQVMN